MELESITVKDYQDAKQTLRRMGFTLIGYVNESPFKEFFIEEYKHEDGRTARTLDLTFLPKAIDLKIYHTYLIQIK